MIVLLFILNELSYDKHHKNGGRIYRITEYNHVHQWMMATTPFPLAKAIQEESPVVEKATRIERISPVAIQKSQEWIMEENIYSCDPALFDMFTLPIVAGNTNDLNDPNTAVLSASHAVKYFGDIDPLEQFLEIKLSDTNLTVRVVGIMKDCPRNITFRPDIVVSPELGPLNMSKTLITTGEKPPSPSEVSRDWDLNFFTTYLMLHEDADTTQVLSAFKSIEKQHFGDESNKTFHLQPLHDIYLGSGHMVNVGNPTGDRQVLYIFSGIGILIILVSLLNYILLYSGQTIIRTKEYGIRKVVGASGKNMLSQVITETTLMVILVIPFCVTLIELLRPIVSQILDKTMVIESQLRWQFPLGFIMITLLVGIIPGVSMTSYISRIRPVIVFEGYRNPRKGQSVLRTILVFCQFIVFNLLIIISLGIYKQVQYPLHKDLGFQWKDLLMVKLSQGSLADHFDLIKSELTSVPGITSISGGMFLPPSNSVMSINTKMLNESDETVNLEALFVDKDFLETMGIELIQGGSISGFSNYDEWKILLNQKAVDQLGKEDPVGEKLMAGQVVGVFKEFNAHSLHKEIPPMMIIASTKNLRQMVIRYDNNSEAKVMSHILKTLKNLFPDGNPEVIKMEEALKELYRKERITAGTVGIFTVISIIIGAMGLFGMSMHLLQRRRKEFAIRKVNGAGFNHIIRLLVKNYLILILSTLAIASPLAVLLLNQWLQNFIYRAGISWWIFAIAAGMVLFIVSSTVGYHIIRAASKNPTESLKYE
jgi:putative ABC transport system permease protein